MPSNRVTIKAINKALSAAGLNCEIAKGEGYFYFTGDSVDLAQEQGVYGIYRLGDYSIDQWVEQARERTAKAVTYKGFELVKTGRKAWDWRVKFPCGRVRWGTESELFADIDLVVSGAGLPSAKENV